MHIYIVMLFEGVDSVVLLPSSKHFESLSFLVGRQVGWLLDYLDDRLANWLAGIEYLLCTPPGRRPGTTVGGEWARPGRGRSIFFTTS